MDAQKPKRLAAIRRILAEALLVAAAGSAIAFTANTLSPRGLKLSRNYFLTGEDTVATNRPAVAMSTNAASNHDAETNLSAVALISVPRLDAKGLQAIDSAQAMRFFKDPRRENDLLVFMDARDEENYQRGHIPGAYELDPYHPDKYLPTVFPVCQAAEVIVVYCTSSDCEDSELGALFLRNIGIPNEKIYVYAGGIMDWQTNHFPVETGDRQSGNISNADK